MQDIIEHPAGVVLSARTFRPLWIFPWTCSIWRQHPFRTSIATVSFDNKQAAEKGHQAIVRLLHDLELSPDMSELFSAIETYAKQNSGQGVKSYRICEGHEVEGKVQIQVQTRPEREQSE